MKNIHLIVATGEWGQDQLRYRRHRLAEFLQKQRDTQEVIWLCPSPQESAMPFSMMPNGIKQWAIKDLFPHKIFRFGRYMDLFYRHKLNSLLLYLRKLEGSYVINLWYTFPGFPLIADLFPWSNIIYDCSDLWSAPINGKRSVGSAFRQNIISKAEQRIINSSSIVFCTSDNLHKRIIEHAADEKKVYTFENGVEFDLFANESLKAEHVLPPDFHGTVLGFIGGIKPKLDFKLIQEVAKKKREWLFLFVGPDGTNQESDFKQLLQEENVRWTGSVDPTEVPKYMNLIDIGIMPYKDSPYNRAVFPLKLFEFLAAGKPVVGVHLPSTEKFARNLAYCHVEASEFITACEQLEEYKENQKLSIKRKQLALTMDWNEVFKGMLQKINGPEEWGIITRSEFDEAKRSEFDEAN